MKRADEFVNRFSLQAKDLKNMATTSRRLAGGLGNLAKMSGWTNEEMNVLITAKRLVEQSADEMAEGAVHLNAKEKKWTALNKQALELTQKIFATVTTVPDKVALIALVSPSDLASYVKGEMRMDRPSDASYFLEYSYGDSLNYLAFKATPSRTDPDFMKLTPQTAAKSIESELNKFHANYMQRRGDAILKFAEFIDKVAGLAPPDAEKKPPRM